MEETVETVIVTVRGSSKFNFNGTNAAVVLIDDSSNTRFILKPMKPTSVYCSFPVIESPAVFDIERRGRSAGSTNLPFLVYTNTGAGLETTTYFRATGDVSGQNVAFAPYASRARVNFTIPEPRRLLPSASVLLQVPSITNTTHEIHFLPEWQFVRFEVVVTNAIEGTATNALLRLSRLVADAPVTATFAVSGNALGPTSGANADHSLASPFTMTIPNGALSVETSVAALVNNGPVGWKSVILTPDLAQTNLSLDPHPPYFVFLREQVADPNAIAAYDSELDGLPDYWEVSNGLDPLDFQDAETDADGDGLTNLDEYQFGTNARAVDTDGDGANDSRETFQGSDPSNAADGGLAPPEDDVVSIRLKVGDHSGSHSERYRLIVGKANYQSPGVGLVGERLFKFRRGQAYPIKLLHTQSTLQPPDYDYTAELLAETNTLPVAFVVDDPQGLMGVHDNDPSFSNKTATLIVPQLEIVWEEVPGNVPLESNPNINGGLRVFPDHTSPTDTTDRRHVIVEVRTTPPAPGQRVWLKSFDVDDPVAPADDPGRIIDTNHFVTLEIGNDNRGTPQEGLLGQTNLTLDVFGKAFTTFEVTLQPGDNFRVAAVLDTEGAQNHLYFLQVNNPFAPYLVSPDQQPVPLFLGALSPMLTVWRKLYLEFDSMAAPPTTGPDVNFVSGSVRRVRLNSPSVGHSRVTVQHDDIVQQSLNLFENGKLEISGVLTNRTLKSTSGPGIAHWITEVEIDAVPTNNLIGLAVKLFDDDERYLQNDPLYPSVLNLTSPPLPADGRSGEFVQAIQYRFRPAYIQLVDANQQGWNTVRTIPFKRNAGPGFQFANSITSDFDVENLQLKGTDRLEFWAFSVVFGYQPSASEDGDPDREVPLRGGTPKKAVPRSSHGFSVVYMESVRDAEFSKRLVEDPDLGDFNLINNQSYLTGRYLKGLYGVIAHEIGHAPGRQGPGTDHAELGLMDEVSPPIDVDVFTAATIKRFRTATTWSD